LFPFGGRRRPAPPGTVTRERRCAPSSHQRGDLSAAASHRRAGSSSASWLDARLTIST
jgi:hypothetical protein